MDDFVAHNFSTGWSVRVVMTVEKKKSVAGQFAVKYEQKRIATSTGYFLLL